MSRKTRTATTSQAQGSSASATGGQSTESSSGRKTVRVDDTATTTTTAHKQTGRKARTVITPSTTGNTQTPITNRSDSAERNSSGSNTETASTHHHPPSTKNTRQSTSKQDPSTQVLEDCNYYHGEMTGHEAEEYLKNVGDFLIRTRVNSNKEVEIFVCVRGKDRVEQERVLPVKGGSWSLNTAKRNFSTVAELIEHHKHLRIPIGGTILGGAVRRPSWKIRSTTVVQERPIGEGAYGQVYSGKLLLQGMQLPIAIKQCHDDMEHEERKELYDEAKMMINFKHTNVVMLIGLVTDVPPLRMIVEYCPGGSLLDFIKKYKLKVHVKTNICRQAADGMTYLSEGAPNIVHRDLAARNCLIGRDGSIKISDFGMSTRRTDEIDDNERTRMAVRWTAPETLRKTRRRFGVASDVYSMGVLMWEVYSDGRRPWDEKPMKAVVKGVKGGDQLPTPPCLANHPELDALLRHCWTLEPKSRPPFSTIAKRLATAEQKLATECPCNPSEIICDHLKKSSKRSSAKDSQHRP